MIELDAENLSLQDFIRIVSCSTGERFMFQSRMSEQVTLLVPESISVRDARAALLLALDAFGLVAVKVGRFTRIMPKAQARGRSRVAPSKPGAQWITVFVSVAVHHMQAVQRLARLFIGSTENVSVHRELNAISLTGEPQRVQQLQQLIIRLSRIEGAWDIAIPSLPMAVDNSDLVTLFEHIIQYRGLQLAVTSLPGSKRLVLIGHHADMARFRPVVTRLTTVTPASVRQWVYRAQHGDVELLRSIFAPQNSRRAAP